MHAISVLKIAILAVVALSGAGCALFYDAMPRAQEAPPVIRPTASNHSPQSTRSLWAGDGRTSLFADPVARSSGDLVLVKIVEDASASRGSRTNIQRDSNLDAGFENLFGSEAYFGNGRRVKRDPITGELKGDMQDIDIQHLMRASSESDFNSDATIQQSGRVTGNVMAEVIERQPSGVLRIYGSQVLTINNEDQVVTVSGLIRASDILPDNSILSSKIANAKILYSGRGPASDASRPGLAMRLYYAIWPF